MDLAQIFAQLQQMRGGAATGGGAAGGTSGAGMGLEDLISGLSGQHGVSTDALSGLLGHLAGQVQSGVTDPTALVQAGAAQSGLDMGTITNLLQGLAAGAGGMGGLAGMLGGGAGSAGGMMGMATSMLDQNKDGSIVDDVLGMASSFLTKK